LSSRFTTENALDRLNSLDAVEEVSKDFCPDLVVPANCECVLIVPVRSLPVEVADAGGRIVLRADSDDMCGGGSVRSSPVSAGPPSHVRLLGETGDVLAQCRALPSQSRGPAAAEFQLLCATGRPFARLVAGGPSCKDRYTLETVHKAQLYFCGSFEHHAVNIMDSSNKLLATTEPCAATRAGGTSSYRLRVAPLADVGLVLCCLLSIEHLQGSADGLMI
jgi:hypothetical protein